MVGGSGVVAVTGDHRAGRRLMRSLVALLEGVPGHRVLVAAGALPRSPGFELTDLLDRLDAFPEQDATARTFLFCAAPTPVEAVRLRSLADRHERLTVIILGALPSAGLSMRVAAGGQLTFDRFGAVDDLAPPRRMPGTPPPLPRRIPVDLS
jgi:hypothetical protein